MSPPRAKVIRAAALLVFSVAVLSSDPQVRADIVFGIQDSTATIGSTGNGFDVTLTNTGSSALTISSFSFEVSTSSSNILFSEANTSTALATYIFGADSALGPVLLSQTPAISILAGDVDTKVYNVPPDGSLVAAGATVGLGHVLYDVLNSAVAGPYTVTFTAEKTGLSDPTGAALTEAITLNTGTITLVAPTIVPEPSSLVLALCGVAALGGVEGMRRLRRSA